MAEDPGSTELEPTTSRRDRAAESLSLAHEWRRLGVAATVVTLLVSPLFYLLLHDTAELGVGLSIVLTVIAVGAFRGLIDVLAHMVVPSPSLYGAEKQLQAEDIVSRRRLWYWRKKYRRVLNLFILFCVVVGVAMVVNAITGNGSGIGDGIEAVGSAIGDFAPVAFGYLPIILILFFANFLILFGPLLFLGAQQIKVYEPGDADWGVKLSDVRGQVEAREEITRIVSLWQSGEDFVKAGGKRERGVMFLGAPGTGKTMLSKAIATSFNCPFVTIPGSGFAQTFIGMDAVLVRFLAWRARKQAAKWGGQCIVFIDEIDAVGMRRQALGGGFSTPAWEELDFHGPLGATNPSGDVVIESEAWRERLFRERAPESRNPYPAFYSKLSRPLERMMIPGMGGGGGLALNSLLVVMDGIDDPPMTRRFMTNRVNTFLDAMYIVPRTVFGRRLRLPPPQPRKDEIYFIGATNVPLERLDPALIRPGRMGRHVYFRTPTWEDRRDIFDLYLAKVAHEPELDTEERRDELARITNGYSPAMIDQICSMALTLAHADGRDRFRWLDLVESMTTVEAGVAIGQPYPKHEELATAIHEAGHAVCSHLFNENLLSTRLSIRKRGNTGGHHQAMYIEDRFGEWRSEQVAHLIHTLGAMAAELIFYGQNTTGVGGDIHSVTSQASRMVGGWGMAPAPVDLSDRITDTEERETAEEEVRERFERLGNQLIHRSGREPTEVTRDRYKRALVAQLVGQAMVIAFNTIRLNRAGTERVAEELVAKGEIFGDDVVRLLDAQELLKPTIDVLDEASWPAI